MNGIRYIEMTDDRHADAVVAMMNALYAEDQSTAPRDPARFLQTLRVLHSEPAQGRVILLLAADDSLHGYALLIPFWSNEFGGTIVFVDELYVVRESRRRGLARGLFEFVERERPFGAIAVSLEVSPANDAAQRLYESLGFEPRPFTTLVRNMPTL